MLNSVSQTVRAHEVTNYEKHAANTIDIKSLKDKVKVISEDILRVDSINSNLKSEINKYSQFTLEHKFYYNDRLSEMKTEMLDGVTQLRTWLTRLELRDTVKESVVNQQRKEIEDLVVEIEQVRKTINSYLEERLKNEAKEVENNTQNTLVNSYATHHLKLLSNRISQLEVELRKTDNFIEKQIPVKYIGEIYEAIDYCFSSKDIRNKIKEFMNFKFIKINKIIENDKGWPLFSKEINKANSKDFIIDYSKASEIINDAEIKTEGNFNDSKKHKSRKLRQSPSKLSLSTMLDPNNLMPLSRNEELNFFSASKSYIKGLDNFTELASKAIERDEDEKGITSSNSELTESIQSKEFNINLQDLTMKNKPKQILVKGIRDHSKRSSLIRKKSEDSKIEIDQYVVRASTTSILKKYKNNKTNTPNKSAKSKLEKKKSNNERTSSSIRK